jgi:hypothetical protein
MIVDTGTSPTAISREMADRLKLHGKAESLLTLNGPIAAESVVLPRIQVGPLYADSVRVVVQDLGFMERSLGISLGGVVGIDVLNIGNFTIDYRRRRIVFGPIDGGQKVVHFDAKLPFVTVKVKVDEQELRLLVDSGTWGLLVFRNRLRTVPEKLHFDPVASIASPGGKTHVSWVRSAVWIGADELGVRNVAIADEELGPENGFDGLLGLAKMGFHKVSFDFENGLFGWD